MVSCYVVSGKRKSVGGGAGGAGSQVGILLFLSLAVPWAGSQETPRLML